jgi:hypothetical protein
LRRLAILFNRLIDLNIFFHAVVLQSHGLIGEGATCYPAKVFREAMQAPSDANVCMTNNIVTSQGPGTSLLFALMLGEQMVSSNCLVLNKTLVTEYFESDTLNGSV